MSEETETVEATTEQTETPSQEERDFVVAEDLEQPTDERPEWLPEKYKTGEDLAKAYKELEAKLGGKEEDIREQTLKEVEEIAFKDRPETSGDYELPDYIDDELAADNPLLKWWSETSWENGFGQDEFEKGLKMYSDGLTADIPDFDEEMGKLGDNATSRVEAVGLFSSQFFEEKHQAALDGLTSTAAGVEVLEHIMGKMKGPSIAATSESPEKLSEDILRQKMADEKYWHPAKRDPAYVKEVQEGWSKLYG